MRNRNKIKLESKKRRQNKVRAKIFGTNKNPRLRVTKSLKYVFLQLIDDENSKTLANVHSKQLKVNGKKVDIAFSAGSALGKKAIKQGIKKCVFDRGGNVYHGVVKAVAEGARKEGLNF
ncbi:MAG: 50S ribosomal protein L18 [Candidatus Kuenenbacteria bacterium]